MAHPRRFRFAADLHSPLPGMTWLDSVREVEQLGYSTLFVPDHFDEGFGPIAAGLGLTLVAQQADLHGGERVLDVAAGSGRHAGTAPCKPLVESVIASLRTLVAPPVVIVVPVAAVIRRVRMPVAPGVPGRPADVPAVVAREVGDAVIEVRVEEGIVVAVAQTPEQRVIRVVPRRIVGVAVVVVATAGPVVAVVAVLDGGTGRHGDG